MALGRKPDHQMRHSSLLILQFLFYINGVGTNHLYLCLANLRFHSVLQMNI